MTLTEAAALVVPSIISGWVGMALKGSLASRQAQGERLGKIEKRIDFEDGRRVGYAQGFEDGLKGHRDAAS